MTWRRWSDTRISSGGAGAAPCHVLVAEELSQLVLKDGTAVCEPHVFMAGWAPLPGWLWGHTLVWVRLQWRRAGCVDSGSLLLSFPEAMLTDLCHPPWGQPMAVGMFSGMWWELGRSHSHPSCACSDDGRHFLWFLEISKYFCLLS